MFDIGWTELLVIAMVAILVVGPKDLPRMLRTFGQTVGKLRRMANEFQGQFNDALKEAERQADVADLKKTVDDINKAAPLADLKNDVKQLNPLNAFDDDDDEAGVTTFRTPPATPKPEGEGAAATEAPADTAAKPAATELLTPTVPDTQVAAPAADKAEAASPAGDEAKA